VEEDGVLIIILQGVTEGFTAARKAKVTSILKMNILKYEKAKEDAFEEHHQARKQITKLLQAARDLHSLALQKSEEEKQGLNKLADIINGLRDNKAANQLRDVMSIWEQRQEILRKKESQLNEKEWAPRFVKLGEDRWAKCKALDEQIHMLESIANVVGIEKAEIR
jgi:hypothetical protein